MTALLPYPGMVQHGSLKSFVCAGQGKFYELFEMDAHVGAEVLGLMYMRVRPQTCLLCSCAS